MPYVYILQSQKDGRYYIGSTVDLNKRLKQHMGGFTPSTKRFGEIKLVFSQKYQTLKQARYIEFKLKKFKRKDFIEKIVADGFIKIRPKEFGSSPDVPTLSEDRGSDRSVGAQ
jgi:putative endonuclease